MIQRLLHSWIKVHVYNYVQFTGHSFNGLRSLKELRLEEMNQLRRINVRVYIFTPDKFYIFSINFTVFQAYAFDGLAPSLEHLSMARSPKLARFDAEAFAATASVYSGFALKRLDLSGCNLSTLNVRWIHYVRWEGNIFGLFLIASFWANLTLRKTFLLTIS